MANPSSVCWMQQALLLWSASFFSASWMFPIDIKHALMPSMFLKSSLELTYPSSYCPNSLLYSTTKQYTLCHLHLPWKLKLLWLAIYPHHSSETAFTKFTMPGILQGQWAIIWSSMMQTQIVLFWVGDITYLPSFSLTLPKSKCPSDLCWTASARFSSHISPKALSMY